MTFFVRWLTAAVGALLIVGVVHASGRCVSAQERAKFDTATLAADVAEIVAKHGNDLRAGLWLGGVDGTAWFETNSAEVFPTASAIKAFYLVELFDRYRGQLDDELVAARSVLTDDRHPAIAHFTSQQRDEIRRELTGASVRRIGEVMIGKTKVSNVVYNAAANLTTAVLGGPKDLTAAIQRRDPVFRGVAVRRYMLADRKASGDNECPPINLANLYLKLAAAKLAGIDDDTMTAIRNVLRGSDDPALGTRFSKGGSLSTDPLTEVRAGWWETKHGSMIYVVMTTQPMPGAQSRTAATESLRGTAARLEEVLVAAGRLGLQP